MEKKRKGVAPDEIGELPNEKRCPRCWGLLGEFENFNGTVVPWCARCQTAYPVKGGEPTDSAGTA